MADRTVSENADHMGIPLRQRCAYHFPHQIYHSLLPDETTGLNHVYDAVWIQTPWADKQMIW